MGEFPSGQRGQTVNLLAMPSMVRIHLPPPKIPITLLGDWYFSLRGRWSRSLSPSGEIHLPPPKIPIVLLDGRYFSLRGRWSRSLSPPGEIHLPPPKIPIVLLDGRYFSFPGRCTNARQMHGAEKNLDRLRQHREEKPHMIRPPTVWAGFCRSAPLTLPVRSGARPAPAATGRPRACQSNRRTPSARRARTATGTHLPTPAAAQNTPRIAASAFLPSGCKIIMHLDNFRS